MFGRDQFADGTRCTDPAPGTRRRIQKLADQRKRAVRNCRLNLAGGIIWLTCAMAGLVLLHPGTCGAHDYPIAAALLEEIHPNEVTAGVLSVAGSLF